MSKPQRLNIDVDRELWKRVSIKCIELDMEKRKFMEQALTNELKRLDK